MTHAHYVGGSVGVSERHVEDKAAVCEGTRASEVTDSCHSLMSALFVSSTTSHD